MTLFNNYTSVLGSSLWDCGQGPSHARRGAASRLQVQAGFTARPYTVRQGDTLESIAEKRGKGASLLSKGSEYCVSSRKADNLESSSGVSCDWPVGCKLSGLQSHGVEIQADTKPLFCCEGPKPPEGCVRLVATPHYFTYFRAYFAYRAYGCYNAELPGIVMSIGLAMAHLSVPQAKGQSLCFFGSVAGTMS